VGSHPKGDQPLAGIPAGRTTLSVVIGTLSVPPK